METTITAAKPGNKTRTRRIIWAACKCGAPAKAYDYSALFIYQFTDKMGVAKYAEPRFSRVVDGVSRDISRDYTCPCGRSRKNAIVKGTPSDHKCDARCEASTSGKCECSCGGANHGRSHL